MQCSKALCSLYHYQNIRSDSRCFSEGHSSLSGSKSVSKVILENSFNNLNNEASVDTSEIDTSLLSSKSKGPKMFLMKHVERLSQEKKSKEDPKIQNLQRRHSI